MRVQPPDHRRSVLLSATSLANRCATAAQRVRALSAETSDPDVRATLLELADMYDALGAHAFLVANPPAVPEATPWWRRWFG